ncbi:MAG: class I SAM-dependent methyltransferase [Ruminococcaceae bacterium]|nr:class I SAM-dependent methyltransferase [Oscillospiraceae bacterium]
MEVYFDFHDVFVSSAEAWKNALRQLGADEAAVTDYELGISKRLICEKYHVSYENLEEEYRKQLRPFKRNITFAKKLSAFVEINILSAARRERLLKDIDKFNLGELFTSVYAKGDYTTKEDFLTQRAKNSDWILFFTHTCQDPMQISNVVIIPIDFYKDRSIADITSFDDHAKTKLLYNQLSSYYMESIANDTLKEVNLLEKAFHLSPKHINSVLDCCCGVGRHAYALGQLGYNVLGVDFSQEQIHNARRLHKHQNVNYQVADVRSMHLVDTFDAAVCMWTTYNYLSKYAELRNFFENVWDALNDNGIFLLDAKNIPALENRRVYIRNNHTRSDVDLTLLVNKEISGNIQNSQYLYFIKHNDDSLFYIDHEHVRFYTVNEIKKICGDLFDVASVYGNFDGDDYDENKSERLIIVLQKRSA